MKVFDSIMTGQLDELSNNLMPSKELSDDYEPGIHQILIEEST